MVDVWHETACKLKKKLSENILGAKSVLWNADLNTKF